jgi:hypothetical protein
MEYLLELVINPVSNIFDQITSWINITAEGSGIAFAFSLMTATLGNFTEKTLADIRRWHGGIDDRYSNIYNLVSLIEKRQPAWTIPTELLQQLSKNCRELEELITHCRTGRASSMDREHRNRLLRSTVRLCLFDVKIWAYGACKAGLLTVDDIHMLGFFMPGERRGRRSRSQATNALAEVKVKIVNADIIRVTVDQAAGKNAAQVAHGRPAGVKFILIVVLSADAKTEIIRRMTTRLHNTLEMPAGSHGQLFIIKASFLRHVDDVPRFGSEETFSLPLTTEDLVNPPNARYSDDRESQRREIESLRREIESLHAELNAKK